jgi:hypothetical protein
VQYGLTPYCTLRASAGMRRVARGAGNVGRNKAEPHCADGAIRLIGRRLLGRGASVQYGLTPYCTLRASGGMRRVERERRAQ